MQAAGPDYGGDLRTGGSTPYYGLTLEGQASKGSPADVGGSEVANIANLVAFRLGVENVDTLTRWFEPIFKAHDLLNLLNHVAVERPLINGQAIRLIEYRTSPLPAP